MVRDTFNSKAENNKPGQVMNKYTGAHVSAAGGVQNAPENAKKIGATAFALFTKNQRQWKAKPLSPENISAFRKNLAESGISPSHILPHDSYLINLGHPDAEKRRKSLEAFVDELERCRQLGLRMLNFHPGSHLNLISEEECLENVITSLDSASEQVGDIIMVIENTAGQGTNIGYSFNHLAHIINGVKRPERMGICIDTCHLFVSGHDIRSAETFNSTMTEFDRQIGFKFLRGMHLNDSKKPLGSRVDRHHSLGRGEIGWEAFRLIMTDQRFDNMPLILETPDPELWPEEIAVLNGFAGPQPSASGNADEK
jgi:deoxyribonuclease-4